MKSFRSKCASCAGGIRILLCSILMSLSVIGTTAISLSKNANIDSSMGNMGSMSSMTTTNIGAGLISQNIMVTFFSGFWGEVILLISFGSMIVGMWFTRTRKVIPLLTAGLVILYISMYVRYSIALEIIGAVILVLAYASAYSYNFAKTIKLA